MKFKKKEGGWTKLKSVFKKTLKTSAGIDFRVCPLIYTFF
jgi:hypothetical protein